MVERSLATARSAAARLTAALNEGSAFDEDMAREYNRAKRALAVSFQSMALEVVPRDAYRLADVKAQVVATMRSMFEGRVDSSLFVIRRYTTPHPDIYALLASHVGSPIPGWRIRLLSGDKIHTERRTRELRDLGLTIDVGGGDDDSSYCLKSLDPDLRYGAAFQLRENAYKSKRINPQNRAEIVRLAEAAAQLPDRK
ncbi:hypothetical protein ACK8HX_05030 [Oryzobacter sp. R7]|uniref:hypothetical protein n=1 Tax=Oryzobacter faecalis TaxID=3388656 RepID=UPI00398D3CF7